MTNQTPDPSAETAERETPHDRLKTEPGYLNGYDAETEADQRHAYIVGFADARRERDAELARLRAQLADRDQDVAIADAARDGFQQQRDVLEAVVADLRAQLAEAESDAHKNALAWAGAADERDANRTEIEQLRAQLAEKDETIAAPKAEAAAFIKACRDKAKQARKARVEEATVWRDGTDETHEEARVLASRMSGRQLPSMSADSREETAARADRIAAKHADEVRLFDAILQQAEAQDAEIARLRAQVEELTKERDTAERQYAEEQRFANSLSLQNAQLEAQHATLTAETETRPIHKI